LNVSGWDWWIALGGTLQVAGVVLLVSDVTRSYAKQEKYRTRSQVVEAGTIHAGATVFPVGVVGGQQPSTDERLARLEKAVGDLRTDLQTTAADLRTEAREAASEAAGRATRHGDRRVSALEIALLGDTRRDKGRRLGKHRCHRRRPAARHDRQHRAVIRLAATLAATPGSKRQDGVGQVRTAGTSDLRNHDSAG
jgi:hypothetical protein